MGGKGAAAAAAAREARGRRRGGVCDRVGDRERKRERAGPERSREPRRKRSRLPVSHRALGRARPAERASLPTTDALPPPARPLARPPVRQPAAARLSVTSRDRSRGGALRPSAHARSRLGLGPGPSFGPGPGPAQEELRGRALAGALPEGSGCGSGCRGLGRSWKGGGREGRLSCPAGPRALEAARVGRRGGTGLTCLPPPGLGRPREASARAGGFSYWLRDLNGEDTGRALGAWGARGVLFPRNSGRGGTRAILMRAF